MKPPRVLVFCCFVLFVALATRLWLCITHNTKSSAQSPEQSLLQPFRFALPLYFLAFNYSRSSAFNIKPWRRACSRTMTSISSPPAVIRLSTASLTSTLTCKMIPSGPVTLPTSPVSLTPLTWAKNQTLPACPTSHQFPLRLPLTNQTTLGESIHGSQRMLHQSPRAKGLLIVLDPKELRFQARSCCLLKERRTFRV